METSVLNHTIPKRADINFAIRAAREFIFSQNIHTIPINPEQIYKDNNWILLTTTEMISQLKNGKLIFNDIDPFQIAHDPNCYAKTYLSNGYYVTIYDPTYPMGMILWTLAHEIGHIVLDHLKKYSETEICRNGLSSSKYRVLENEANYFASELLAPKLLLKYCNCHTDELLIQKLCGISKEASIIIKDTIEKHTHKLVYTQSKNFIYRQFFHFITRKEYNRLTFNFSCKNCDNILTSNSKFCNICGNVDPIEKEGLYYDELINFKINSKVLFCPRCHNHEFNKDTLFCRICGSPLKNTCMDLNNCSCNKSFKNNSRYCDDCGSPTTFNTYNVLQEWSKVKELILDRKKDFDDTREDFDDDYFRDWDYLLKTLETEYTVDLYLNLQYSKCRVVSTTVFIYLNKFNNIELVDTPLNIKIIISNFKKYLNLHINAVKFYI